MIPVPAWPLRLALGGFAEELLLSGQRVIPDAAVRSEFIFEYPTLDAALAQIVGKPTRQAANGLAGARATAALA